MIAGFALSPVFGGEGYSRADISWKARASIAQGPEGFMANLAIVEWDQEGHARPHTILQGEWNDSCMAQSSSRLTPPPRRQYHQDALPSIWA
jgi:hypothetical protein